MDGHPPARSPASGLGRAVAERARRLGCVRVTHRDSSDFYLTSADQEDQEEERDENLLAAARLFGALSRDQAGARAVASAISEVFPWARRLSAAARSGFAAELVAALLDAAEPAVEREAHELVAGWRATARIKADKGLYAAALEPTEGDFGRPEAMG